MARARLRDKHQENLRKKLEVLKAEQKVAEVKSEIKSEPPSSSDEDSEEEPRRGTSVKDAKAIPRIPLPKTSCAEEEPKIEPNVNEEDEELTEDMELLVYLFPLDLFLFT